PSLRRAASFATRRWLVSRIELSVANRFELDCLELACRAFRRGSMLSAGPSRFEWPPGFQSLRDLEPWRHTLALSSARLRVNAFGNASVCRRVEGVGAQRRRPEPGAL